MAVKIKYGTTEIAEIENRQVATLVCKDMVMEENVEIEVDFPSNTVSEYDGTIEITDIISLDAYSFSVTYPDGTKKIYQIDEYEEMTWEEWINSEYNTDGFYLSGATDPEVIIGENLGYGGTYCYLADNGAFVVYNEPVKGGHEYGYEETDYNG